MTIEKEDKPNYNKEEPKPEWRETKNYKYQIFKEQIRFIYQDKELPVSIGEFQHILENYNSFIKDGTYVGQCILCHKFDSLVKGYCKPCFDKEGMEY